VHLSYVRERTGHALIGARQWIPQEHLSDPVRSQVMGLPDDLVFRTKGELAIDICTDAFADGAAVDFVCGDETSEAVKLSSCFGVCCGCGRWEGGVLVVVLAGGQAVVQAAEEPVEQVALGGGVPVSGVAAAVIVGAGAG
jgi:hypothetical protein